MECQYSLCPIFLIIIFFFGSMSPLSWWMPFTKEEGRFNVFFGGFWCCVFLSSSSAGHAGHDGHDGHAGEMCQM